MAETLPKLLKKNAVDFSADPVQYSKDEQDNFQPTTYGQLFDEVKQCASGLASLGIKRGDHVGLISENRKEWLIMDLAVLSLGAADVPRGNDSMADEIRYILKFSDCETTIAENETQFKKIVSVLEDLNKLTQIIVLDQSFQPSEHKVKGISVYTFADVMDKGADYIEKNPDYVEKEIEQGKGDDVATLIFTSGTTGEPKGVMLSHRNFLHQVEHVPELLTVGRGDIWLAVLPVWHSFERIMQYIAVGTGSAIAYSKPVGKIFLGDFAKIRPSWMAGVPRLWEAVRSGIYRNVKSQGGVKKALFLFFVGVGGLHSHLENMMKGLLPRFKRRSRLLEIFLAVIPYLLLYPIRGLGNILVFKKIKHKLGGRFIAGISGGGALPSHVDRFFAAAGILLLEGYGLTETAPVLGVRKQWHPVPNTVGPVFPGTEIKIVDEAGNKLPPGHKGLVLARGPQVMLGYYKKPEETKKILSEDCWLDTGDLGMLTHNNELKIVGRAKDTIVLLGGENIEPVPIEDKLRESEFVDQAILLGQDQKFLACLIIPNTERLEEYAEENSVSYMDIESLIQTPEVQELFNDIINTQISPANGFKNFERIYRFKLINATLEVGKELSAKQEVKRHIVNDLYKKEIQKLFA
jgi:long-chain acyl-CoA synthetase